MPSVRLATEVSGNPSGDRRPEPCVIGTIPVDRLSFEEVVAFVTNRMVQPRQGPPLRIVGPNAQMVTLAKKNAVFAEAMRSADLRVPDGISVVLASRVLKRPIPERVPGGELMERLCAQSAKHGLSVFFLGGLPNAAEKAAKVLKHRYPGLRFAGTYCPPYKFEEDASEMKRVRQMIAETSPDLLFVALGAPRQEIWMWQHCATMPIRAVMSVGAGFDTTAGLRKRAPAWAQKSGTEWFYRLLMEPRRLWRRYLIGNTHFIYIVFKAWLTQKVTPQAL
jgi:N-acetylglucosaminyldiphosphoundecaprenol N-acetyl-beta-D-mannosaminyltransferase